MFKTILCIPPDYDRNFPPLGTPALAAFLKHKGIECSQIDLNMPYRDFLSGLVSGSSDLNREEKLFFLKPLLAKFFAHKLQNKYYSSILPRASDKIFPCLPYDNNTNSSFYFCERLLSSQYLWRYLEDEGENTFLQFFKRKGIIPYLKQGDVRLLGISVTSPAQAIASLTLGLLVKRSCPHIHVTIGGQWPTLYRHAILEKRELFRCFDTMVIFEGESALYELSKRIDEKRDLSSIPNLITADTVSAADIAVRQENMDTLPCPDFDGLCLQEYDGSKDGQISMTFETSRGCYWSKCAYCVDLPLPKPSYRPKSVDLVVRDMKALKHRYGAQYLLFGDPGLSPRQMLELSGKMIEQNIGMEWWTMARLDPGFDSRLFDIARQAGLRQINFGFESASDRVCGLLDKGNSKERSSRIIRDCANAGIKVDLQTMLGLPGESFEDGMETIDFLISHKKYISHVTFNIYYLTPGNHVYENPGKYGIEYEKRSQLPFRFFIPFKNVNGMDMEQAYLLEKIYYSLLHKDSEGLASAAIAAPEHSLDGYAYFSLNKESCSQRYMLDQATKTYTLFDDDKA